MTIWRMLAAAALVLGLSEAAHAVRLLTTPVTVGSDGIITCHAVNIGRKQLSLNVSLVTLNGVELSISCSADPGEGCTRRSSSNVTRYCKIKFRGDKSSVRGALTVEGRDGNSILSIEAQ
jgi:hypothetical protein